MDAVPNSANCKHLRSIPLNQLTRKVYNGNRWQIWWTVVSLPRKISLEVWWTEALALDVSLRCFLSAFVMTASYEPSSPSSNLNTNGILQLKRRRTQQFSLYPSQHFLAVPINFIKHSFWMTLILQNHTSIRHVVPTKNHELWNCVCWYDNYMLFSRWV